MLFLYATLIIGLAGYVIARGEIGGFRPAALWTHASIYWIWIVAGTGMLAERQVLHGPLADYAARYGNTLVLVAALVAKVCFSRLEEEHKRGLASAVSPDEDDRSHQSNDPYVTVSRRARKRNHKNHQG